MSERDELARLLFITDNHSPDAERDWVHLQPQTKYLSGYYAEADAILAAGYRKPHIITTGDELDALAEGSLILDSDPDVLVKRKGRWRSPDHPDDSFGPASVGFPVTVLHEGTQP